MKKGLLFYVICGILIISAECSVAQSEISEKSTDSLNTAILQDYHARVAEFEKQKVADSMKKSELEARLTSLKTTDVLQKDDLLNQIRKLKDKDSVRIAQKKSRIDSLRLTAKGYPVKGFFNDTLFLIYNKLGGFSARERAEAVTKRIHDLASDYRFRPDLLKVVEIESTADILAGEVLIIGISETDAIWNNSTRHELALRYAAIIGKAVVKFREETTWLMLSKEIGLALLVLLLTWGLLFYTSKLSAYINRKLQMQQGRRIKGIKIKDYTLFDEGRQVRVLSAVNGVLKWFVFLIIIYIALPILFGIFPWTKNLATVLIGYILNPVKNIAIAFWDYVPNLITIVVIVVIFRYFLKGIHFLKDEVAKGHLHIPGFYPDWANPTFQIIRGVMYAFLIVVVFPYLPGSDSPVFKGVSVFLGFLVTFGSAGSLSNLIAGLVITYMRLFKIGDRVRIGGDVGDVIEKSVLVTRVRTIKNEVVSIPNSTVMNSHTVNYSSDAPEKGLIINTTVTIGYDNPWREIHQALIDAALKTDLILHDPRPFVMQTSLDDFYVSYQINAYTREPNQQAMIYSWLHQNIQDVCNERGIEIMSPHYRAQRDGSSITIPEGYRPKDNQYSN